MLFVAEDACLLTLKDASTRLNVGLPRTRLRILRKAGISELRRIGPRDLSLEIKIFLLAISCTQHLPKIVS